MREEKMDIDHEFSERLKAIEITHQAEMQKRESLYQSACRAVPCVCVSCTRGLRPRRAWPPSLRGLALAHPPVAACVD